MANKVLNQKECNFLTVVGVGNHLYGARTIFKSEKLDVVNIYIVEDRSRYNNSMVDRITDSVNSTLLGGLIGNMLSGLSNNEKTYSVDLDIYLTDGTVIEVNSNEPNFIQKAMKFVQTKNPRDKFRKKRGISV